MITNEIIDRIKARKRFRKRTLRNIRWQMIKDEYIIWLLLLFSLIFPLFPFARLGISSCLLHSFRVVLDNVCYGYIAGMIFYLFSDFRPRSQKILKSKQKLAETYRTLYTKFAIIADLLAVVNNNNEIIDGYKEAALSVLVESSHGNKLVIVNERMLCKIKACFVLVRNDIDTLILMYRDVLTDEELINLNRHNHVYEKLHYSSLFEYTKSDKVCVNNADLNYFVEDFCLNYDIIKRLKEQYGMYLFHKISF